MKRSVLPPGPRFMQISRPPRRRIQRVPELFAQSCSVWDLVAQPSTRNHGDGLADDVHHCHRPSSRVAASPGESLQKVRDLHRQQHTHDDERPAAVRLRTCLVAPAAASPSLGPAASSLEATCPLSERCRAGLLAVGVVCCCGNSLECCGCRGANSIRARRPGAKAAGV